MAEYTLTTPTAVPLGGAVPYTNTIIKGCCNIKHRAGSGQVTVRGGTCCNPAKYLVYFHANVTGVAGAIQLALFLDGERLPETLMAVVPATATDVWSVSAETEFCVDCCCGTVSARVVEGATVTVNTAEIIVKKEVA